MATKQEYYCALIGKICRRAEVEAHYKSLNDHTSMDVVLPGPCGKGSYETTRQTKNAEFDNSCSEAIGALRERLVKKTAESTMFSYRSKPYQVEALINGMIVAKVEKGILISW